MLVIVEPSAQAVKRQAARLGRRLDLASRSLKCMLIFFKRHTFREPRSWSG